MLSSTVSDQQNFHASGVYSPAGEKKNRRFRRNPTSVSGRSCSLLEANVVFLTFHPAPMRYPEDRACWEWEPGATGASEPFHNLCWRKQCTHVIFQPSNGSQSWTASLVF